MPALLSSLSSTRRLNLRALLALGLSGFLPALPACASRLPVGPNGTRSYTVPLAQLQELIGRKFPQRRRLSGLIELTLLRPRLRLLPEANRLGTLIDLVAAEMVMGTRYEGSMDLEYGVRFDAADGRIRMSDVRVGKVDVPAVPLPYQPLFQNHAPRVAEQLLDGLILHEVKPEELAMVNGLGFKVGEVRVAREGLRVELLPVFGGS